MTDCILQEAEKLYIIHGIQDNLRNDGRNCLDYRIIELETGIIPNVNGSAMVKVGETKVIAGVKAELMTVPQNVLSTKKEQIEISELTVPQNDQSTKKGRIEISIESTPHANLEFEGRGGDDFASDVSQILTQVFNDEKLISLEKLCVIPDLQIWVLYVDILVIGYGGNLMDVASIATIAALHDTKIQNVKINDSNNEIELSGDPFDVFSLNVTTLPILLTLFRVGTEFIVDATREEEACSKAKLLFAVSPRSMVYMKEFGSPGSLHIDSISDAIEISEDMGVKLQKQLIENLQLESTFTTQKKYLLP